MRKIWSTSVTTFLFLLALQAGTQASGAIVKDRITQPIESANRVTVAGSVHPMAEAQFEAGLVDNAKVLTGLVLNFKRSDAQQTSLKTLLQAQQDPSSPSYHHWLTPTQFGQQFGMTAADVAKASSWLESQGFTVTWVSPSSNAIGFSGSVASVEQAFSTQIHSYRVNDETHFANSTPISLPAALAGLVTSVRGLNDFRPKPKVRPAIKLGSSAAPQFTSGISGTHYLTPADFATIYDLGPLYSASITGKGITIAILGQTDIVPADISDFRSAAGLPANNPTVVTFPGTVPLTVAAGAASGDLSETDLDLEWSGGIATGASIVLVNSDNVFNSLQYAVQNPINGFVPPIISLSYGACESAFAKSDTDTLEGYLQQANVQGQTVFLASGDSGAADCDSGGTPTNPVKSAVNGLAVDYPGSSVYVTSVGGTEFTGDGTAASPKTGDDQYWSAQSGGGAANDLISSAKSYIPEMAWNDTAFSIAQTSGSLSGGGGGVSILWNKPSWQTGVPGLPADTKRDVPDVAFPSSPDHDGLLYCSQIQTTGSGTSYVSSCSTTSFRVSDPGQSDDLGLTAAGGTSFAAPSFAGLMAITEQKLGVGSAGDGLGNINPSLYTMAANATTYASAFHDVTAGGNQVPCTTGSTGCATTGSNNTIGYAAGPGYDQATGLGSVDGNNFVTAYAALVTAIGTKTTITAVPASALTTNEPVTLTATVTPNTLTSAPAGTVVFTVDGAQQSPVTLSTAAPFTGVLTETNGFTTGTHTIIATFVSSSGAYLGSTGALTLPVTAPGTAPTSVTVSANPTTVGLGGAVSLSAVVTAPASGTLTGPMVFSIGNVTIGKVGQVTLQAGNTAIATLNISAATASLGFTPGTDTITASYQGDVFNAPSSGSTTVTVTNPGITLSATNITISSPSPGHSGTSTITLTSTGSYAGTAVVTASASSLNANYGFGSTGATSASVPLTAGGTGTTTIVITTVAATGNLQSGPAGNFRKIAAAGGTMAGCVLLLLIPGIRRKRWPVALMMLVFLSVGAGLGCGGGTGGAAPKGTYTVTLSAADSSNANITGTTNFTVTIQ